MITGSVDLLEGPDGDILSASQYATGLDLTMQRVRRRLDRFLGDWILDSSLGLPFFEWAAQKPPQVQSIGARVRAEIETTPGVSGVSEWEGSFERATRELVFSCVVHTTDGDTTLTATLFGEPGTGNRNPALRLLIGRRSIAHG